MLRCVDVLKQLPLLVLNGAGDSDVVIFFTNNAGVGKNMEESVFR